MTEIIKNVPRKLRKEKSGIAFFYRYLINNNFPDGFQAMCRDCNRMEGFYGKYPHTS